MSYFIPSFFQKRILRYALSKLELLDTEAMDLDKLDIVWGKKSTVELRGVGIHTKKLAALLELPRSLAIVSAQILFLRLSIPADLYKSGIVVEAQDIDVHMNVDFEGQEKETSNSPKGQRRQQERRSTADRPRSTQTHVHDPGGPKYYQSPTIDSDNEEEPPEYVPTSTDLAKSYLQAEPKEKKAELQAAIAQSQHLDESQISNENGKETSGLGVGSPISLPGFLADFLKGVGDRIQLQINNVALNVNLKVDSPSEGSTRSDASDKSELVTIRLAVGDIVLGGVTDRPFTTGQDEFYGTSDGDSRHIRRLTLDNIRAMLISEASLFTSLARSTGPSSPQATHSSTMDNSSGKSTQTSTRNAELGMSPSASKTSYRKSRQDLGSSVSGSQSKTFADSECMSDSKGNTNSKDMFSSADSQYHGSTSADPSFPAGTHSPSERENSADSGIVPVSLHTGPVDLEHPLPSSLEPRRKHPTGASHGDETPPTTSQTAGAGLLTNQNEENINDAREWMSRHSEGLEIQKRLSSFPDFSRSTGGSDGGSPSKFSSPTSDRSSPVSEDLSQSKLFTHEEAESMYMSAVSHASTDSKSRKVSMPGKWDFSGAETEEEASIPPIPQGRSRIEDRFITSIENSWPVTPVSEISTDGKDDQYSRFRNPHFMDRAPTPHAAALGVERTEHEVPAKDIKQERFLSEGSETSSGGFKNSFTMAKHILTIDTIAIELPQAASRVSQDAADAGISNGTANVGSKSQDSQNNGDAPPLSVSIGSIHLYGDMGLTRMIMLIVQEVTSVRISASHKNKNSDIAGYTSSSKNHFNLTVKQACWKFLDVVKGSPMSNIRTDQPKQFFPSDSEVLLKAEIQKVQAVYRSKDGSSTSRISLGKFSFGYASENLLAFDSGLKMRDSTRDMLAPKEDDIEVTIVQSSSVRKIEITTVPLHVALDLRRLDETFGWFGGLSSMLDLGNSMVSTVTIKDPNTRLPRLNKTGRGVHFENPHPSKPSQGPFSQPRNKLTARLGGLVLDLVGTQTSLRFESTAVRLVSRVERLGVQIDRIKLSGPYLHRSEYEPSIVVKLRSLRVEYLSTPIDDDLDRLVALLSPSNDKYERDDDILLDTLLRQRSKGGVLRLTIESLDSHLSDMDHLQCVPALTEDLKKLSKVAKYLPEDDRPGMLSLVLIRNVKVGAFFNDRFGDATLTAHDLELAHVTFPVLMALAVRIVKVHRNDVEKLLGDARPIEADGEKRIPMLIARFIGNEMEPTAKVKLYNAQFEYRVTTVMAIMGYEEATEAETVIADLVNSVATLTAHTQVNCSPPNLSGNGSANSNTSASAKALRIDIVLRDSILGLNPRNSQAKGLIVFTDTHFLGAIPKEDEANAILEIRKAGIMVIDDIANCTQADPANTRRSFDIKRSQVEVLSDSGYVTVTSISAAKAELRLENYPSKAIDIDIRDDLFILETCADSTHTLQSILSGLNPPTPPSTELKYRTEVVPVEDMLASFTGDAFATRQRKEEGDDDINDDLPLGLDEGDMVEDEVPQNLEYVSSFYNPDPDALSQGITDSMLEDDLESLAAPSVIREIGDRNVLENFEEQTQIAPGSMSLDFQDDHFDSNLTVGGTAHTWNSAQNTYGMSNNPKLRSSPLRVRVRDVHFIWNLFDGYDWQHTRNVITHAVDEVQSKATERFSRRDKRRSLDPEEEQETVIGDFLFNSIYIGVPANRDPKELPRQVNRDIDDLVSETDTYTMSSASGSPSRQGHVPRLRKQKLRLMRSKHHKMAFELKGISADVVVFPPGSGETQSSIDIRIQDLEIYDHLPTSTWRKFATYLYDIGERESGTSMVHLEVLNVKPVPDLAASEIMLKATILPLRLHVDQDALDFLTRFFEFKGDSAPSQTSKSEAPFLQRVEVNSIRVKLDFKPKRVDYAGLRSGRTTEFMNFIVLQEANMVLRHAIIYGVSGFEKLGKTLNDIWMPDVKRNQLPGILAGLAPVRSLVNVGGGVRDLVVVPIREYRKDGRVVRSFQKGAVAFARTTTTELVKLGAKLANGTQTILQGAESLLSPASPTRQDVSIGWEDAEIDDDEKKQISLYADQPIGVIQGLRGGYASLESDLLMAKDAIIAMPGEILETGTAGGAAKAVLRNAPTVILRPVMGVSKAVGQTLMGATNSLDPGHRRRVEDKYKKH